MTVYRFADFTLDERTRQLRRGSERLQLRAKCFDALQFFVRHANVTITKPQIISALWNDREVDDGSLTQLIYELRRAIGDFKGEMVVTLPSLGYRFTPRVHAMPADSPLERYVEPVNVYELYAKGMYLLEKPGKQRFLQALNLFERAVTLMPAYAPAYLGLGNIWLTMACSIYVPPSPAFEDAREAARQALIIDDNLAEAHALLANAALFYDRDWQTTERCASQALAMNPSLQLAHQALAWMYVATGNLDAAIKAVIKTIEMIPASLALQVTLAVVYRYRGDIDKSIALFRSVLEMDAGYDLARYYLGNTLIGKGFVDAGIAELERVAAVEPTVQVRSSLAYAYAQTADRARAEEMLRTLKAETATQYVAPYALALVHAGLHEYDAAMREIRRAVQERSPWLIFLGVEPRFGVLQARRDFQQILVDLGLRRLAA